jgi:hypothetical protein
MSSRHQPPLAAPTAAARHTAIVLLRLAAACAAMPVAGQYQFTSKTNQHVATKRPQNSNRRLAAFFTSTRKVNTSQQSAHKIPIVS